MRILFVYPEFPDTFWSFKHALQFIRKKASFPPLGLLTVAALLPREWEKRLIDMNVTTLRREDVEWADYVFLSAMVVQRESARQVIRLCKDIGTKIVAGGPLFIGEYQDFDEVDHFVLGEGEVTLPLFLEDLARGQPKRVYQSNEFADMTKTPTPLWELMDMKQYSSMCIQYSRGCPFNCEFCNITAMFGHRPRTKTAQQIIAELDALYELGWRGGVFFVDDNFIGNKRQLKTEILPALIEWRKDKKGFGFQTEVSINLADDPELLRLMVEAGFDRVFVGIETPDEESLAECNKFQNRGRDLAAAVRTLQHAGLEVQGGFIVGFDSDKPSIFQRQIDFIQRTGIVTAMVGLLQAPYGTRLYERLKAEGRLLGKLSGNNTDNTMNFIPKMDPDILHRGYERILNTIYSPRHYYERVRTFLKEYQKPPTIKPVLQKEHILAFFKSIVKLGIWGKERLEYWKLFFWALFRRPKLFPQAITFAVYGYHFRRICELYIGRDQARQTSPS
ncbi:MAG: B12-binding domain-containing radical SAM protein [Anaerolineae bacterium]|nr:B12-binding domain-containing radical SAM protein [Anaerolineae bacterium]